MTHRVFPSVVPFLLGMILSILPARAEDWAAFDTQEKDGSFSTKVTNLSGDTRVLSKGNVIGVAGRRTVVCRHRQGGEVIRFMAPTGLEVRPAVPSTYTVSISPRGSFAVTIDSKTINRIDMKRGAPQKLH